MIKCNHDALLVRMFKNYRNLRHPFERELAGMESFEAWEYRRSSHAWKVFSPYASLDKLFAHKKIVDIGCGGGGKSLALLAYAPSELIGVDLNADFISKARSYGAQFEGRSSFICADAAHMPLEDASIDVVTLLDAFEHLSCPEKILKECGRILKPSGKLLISFPPYYHPQGAHVSDLIPFPWVHLFFTEKALCEAYVHLSAFRPDGGRRRKLKCTFDGSEWKMDYINYMTISKAESIIASLDFHLKYFKLIPLRNVVAPLVKFKGLREFFTHTVVIVMEKGG